jgi:hypothetical protein
MKTKILATAVALVAGTLLAADPKEEVKSAAKKLGDKANYSWKQTVAVPEGTQFRPGPTEGKTEKDGYTLITSTFGDNTIETVIKGEKRAVKMQNGWQSAEELAAAGGGGGGGRGRGGFFRNVRTPAAQVEDLAGKVKDLKVSDGVYSGDLTEDGAKSLLSFGGRGGGQGPEISGAKGSVKIWVKDGVLSKFETKIEGTMSINGNDIKMDRTTTVEIKDVGATKIEVPDEAKKKLS